MNVGRGKYAEIIIFIYFFILYSVLQQTCIQKEFHVMMLARGGYMLLGRVGGGSLKIYQPPPTDY